VLVPALAVLLLGSVVFAAAGGVELVKGWIMTMTIEVDGEVIAVEDLVLDEDGRATITLPEELEEGEAITISLEGESPHDEAGEGQMVTIEGSVEDNVVEVHLTVEEEDPEE
jgi:hypothetical protein